MATIPGDASVSGHGTSMDRIHALLEHGFPWMTFPPDIEQKFQHDRAEERTRHFCISGLISLFVYNGFLLADYLLTPDVFVLAAAFRLLVFTPIALIPLYLVYKKSPVWIRLASPALVDRLALMGGVGAALSMCPAPMLSNSPLLYFYPAGFLVVITYGNAVLRLRFWFAVTFTVVVLAIFMAVVALKPTFPPYLLWSLALMLWSVALFTLSGNYVQERDERRRYLLILSERSLVNDLSLAQTRLREVSQTDALTALHNRGHIQSHLRLTWERARWVGDPFSLVLVNIDHFKKFNDRYGNPAGDECLQKVAQVLMDSPQTADGAVARYSGDEFMMVLPKTDAEQAMGVAERLRQAVENLGVRHEGSPTARQLTVSVGVVSCDALPHLTVDQVIAAGERALQQAKHEGRNRVFSTAQLAMV